MEQSNQLECSICLDVFTDPRVIQCGHTFCFKCITSASVTQIICPLCRSIHPNSSQLPINYVLKDVIELFKKLNIGHSIPPCVCGKSKSIKYCSKCETFLCETCLQSHSSTVYTKNHSVVDSKEKGRFESKCPEHEDVMRNYCTKCEKLVCSSCVVFHHLDHKEMVLMTKRAADKQRELFNQMIQPLKTQQQTIQSNISLLDKNIFETEEKLKELKKEKDNLTLESQSIQQSIDAFQRASAGLNDLQLLDKTNIDQLLKILKINPLPLTKLNGSFLRKFGSNGSADGQLNCPYGVSVDLNGNILVADYNNNRIVVFNSNGTFLRNFGDGQLNGPIDIAVDLNGNIIVADYNNNRIVVFNSNGTFLRKFGSKGSADGQLLYPVCVAVDMNGNIFIADSGNHRIVIFNTNGNFVRKFGTLGSGDGQLNNPCGIAVDTNRHVFVADYSNNRIVVFNSDGTFLRKFGLTGSQHGQLNCPWGVTVDVNRNIFVVDRENNRIVVFKSDGTFLQQFGSHGDGQLNWPIGVVIDKKGDIFISDFNNHRIVVYN